ncbi:tRNA (adenosine(37)-N6)-threonylcarbamoyltransferase complex dimerization subunit type 1 TsaB [Candidatus Saccharibacteria bacterium 32-49-10]|nr:MAG: tRNA (adenosine(37)-N6)-threonylcarbamoyltransferase complex dimerization subunit type 1 TsaB [Candidatus Saccharibacteria bacterium 32-49-10]
MDTSTPTCRVWLVDDAGAVLLQDEWEAGRELSTGILAYIQRILARLDADWDGISGVVAYRGPGSFTGLRIGLTVLNTLSRAQQIPIVGVTGEGWLERGTARLLSGENDTLVMPTYGAAPNITKPRK